MGACSTRGKNAYNISVRNLIEKRPLTNAGIEGRKLLQHIIRNSV
jgi:hypothetical protein